MALAGEVTYTDEIGMTDLGKTMEQLRLAGFMPDVVIQAKANKEVSAHRIVLAARFPYLRELLSCPPGETSTKLEWSRISANTIETVVSFAYTGTIKLTASNVLRIYLLATSLRSSTLQKFSLQFLQPRICMENIENAWAVAVQTSTDELKSTCIAYIGNNLAKCHIMPWFPNLDPNSLIQVLRKPVNISSSGEETKLLAISSWCEASVEDGWVSHLNDLLLTIRWNRLAFNFIHEQMGANTKIFNYPEARKLISKMLSQKQHFDGIFVIGQNTTNANLYDIIQYNCHTGNESKIGNFAYRQSASLAAVNDRLYLIGGGQPPTANMTAFNLTQNTEENLMSMSSARSDTGVTLSINEIIVCGGFDVSNQLTSCEVYQLTHNRWIHMPNLNCARSSLRVVWLPDGRIFAIGGYDGSNACNSVEMLSRPWNATEPTEGEWRLIAPLLTARRSFGAVSLLDVIIVAGGINTDDGELASVEIFAPPAADDTVGMGQWTEIQPMKAPMQIYSIVALDCECFIFGINSGIQRFQKSQTTKDAAVSGPFETWEWKCMYPLTSVNNEVQAVSFL